MLQFLKKVLPKSILSRFFIILIAPVILSQIIFGYVFFGRHTETVMGFTSSMVAGDIKLMKRVLDDNYLRSDYLSIAKDMDMNVEVLDNSNLKKNGINGRGRIYKALYKACKLKNLDNFFIKKQGKNFIVYVESDEKLHSVYKISFLVKRLYSRTTPLVVIWGASSAIVLLIIAFIFLKNQIRPIKRLAAAMTEFGMGGDVNYYNPDGAIEIRMAGVSFCEMRENFRKLMNDKMNTLACISHDLKTPLTRMKLQIALMKKTKEVEGLLDDVNIMIKITDSFMLHAHEQNKESFSYHNLFNFLNKITKNEKFPIHLDGDKSIQIYVKQTFFRRAIENVISNSKKYANNLYINFYHQKERLIIEMQDDGPGIDPLIISEIFNSFFSDNKARTMPHGEDAELINVGLGLSIAKDVILDHGGTISASNSKQYGGASFIIDLPANIQ